MLMELLIVLGLLFLVVFILAPVIAYIYRQRAQDQAEDGDKTQSEDESAASDE